MGLSEAQFAVLRVAFEAFEPADGTADLEKLVTKLLEFGMPNEDDNSTKLREKLNAKGSVRVQEFVTESRLAVPFSVKSLSSVLLDYPTNPE